MQAKNASHIIHPLSVIFSNSASVDKLQDEWRCAVVMILAKGSLPDDITNYHLISLTSAVCILMEQVIVNQVLDYIHSHGN